METLRERVLTRLGEVANGTSQNELARRVGMAPSALSRALGETRGLTGDELVRLARELQVSVDWLLTGEDPFPVKIAARHLFSVERGHELSRSAVAERALLEDIALAYRQAPNLSANLQRAIPTDPDEARAVLAEEFGYEWPRFFADAVEQVFGVDVVKVDLADGAGYSMSLTTGIIIVVPTSNFWGRQNWTIAHELGHIARGEFTPIEQKAAADTESAANDYAAQLLLPKERLSEAHAAAMDPARLATFLWDTGVSLDALNRRLTRCGLARVECELTTGQLIRRYPPVPIRPFDDPITDRWRAAGTRRFPTRLLAAHEGTPSTKRTLAWMLGVTESEDEDTKPTSTDINTAMAAFGFTSDQ